MNNLYKHIQNATLQDKCIHDTEELFHLSEMTKCIKCKKCELIIDEYKMTESEIDRMNNVLGDVN